MKNKNRQMRQNQITAHSAISVNDISIPCFSKEGSFEEAVIGNQTQSLFDLFRDTKNDSYLKGM